MKWIKHILPLVLTLCILLSAAACGNKTNTEDIPPESTDSGNVSSVTETTLPTPSVTLKLVENGKSDFKIIYPEGAGATLMREISDLVKTVKDYTGATLTYTDDFTRESAEALSASYEILLGSTTRAESGRWINQDLGSGEYVVVAEGNKLVLGGHTEQAIIAAINYFTKNFIFDNEALTRGGVGSITFTDLDNYAIERSYKITDMTVNGTPVKQMAIVVPDDGYAESYIANLLVKHIAANHGARLQVLTESEAADKAANAIRIGKTAATATRPAAGQYAIAVTDSGLEIVSDSVYGYTEAFYALQQQILIPKDKKVTLTHGQSWSGADEAPAALNTRGDIRLVYHNIWGYLNTDKSNPVSMRAEIAIPIYQSMMPDILCFEEAGSAFRTSARPLFKWLSEAGYGEICFASQGGEGNPIFYRKDVLEIVDQGYAKERNGDKGTTWAVFRLKADPTVLFGVTNSHFAANSNAGGDAELGDTYRTQDAKAAAGAVTAMLSKHGNIPVFTGGDFNCRPGSQPYRVLTDAGLVNVRKLTDKASDIKPYHGSYKYDNNYDLYDLATPALPGTADDSIDHIMAIRGDAKILQYVVMTDPISTTISDHCPHFVDITLK